MSSCPHERLIRRYLGEDPANGRYADVYLESCPACGRQWLHYALEIEGFSHSSRWYRGEVTAEQAANVTAETAAALLESLPAYEAGGSYFDGHVHTRSGPLA
jgi:hypothetical protein